MVKQLEYGVELKKVDEQGRFILPADWRESGNLAKAENYTSSKEKAT